MKGKALKELARGLRREQTEAEKMLWWQLRCRQLGQVKFRRQQPFGPYILDFCSLEYHLVIELDGGQHADRQELDIKRSDFLKQQGFQVIRFWNHEVLSNIEAVLEVVRRALESPSPYPLPSRERKPNRGIDAIP